MRIKWNFKILNVLNILTFQNVFQLHYYASIAKVWGKIIFVDVVVFSCNAKGPRHTQILGLGKNCVMQMLNFHMWSCSNFLTYLTQIPSYTSKVTKISVSLICFIGNHVSGGSPVWKKLLGWHELSLRELL